MCQFYSEVPSSPTECFSRKTVSSLKHGTLVTLKTDEANSAIEKATSFEEKPRVANKRKETKRVDL